jgi:hypothetical protein
MKDMKGNAMATSRRRKAAIPTGSSSRSYAPDQAQTYEDLSQNVSIAQLHKKVDDLNQAVVGLAGLSAIENVIGAGFETLIAQVQPLRDIATPRQPLVKEENARLTALRASLERPVWSSAGSLSIPEMRVPFMFENVPGPPLPQDTPPYRNPGQGRQ